MMDEALIEVRDLLETALGVKVKTCYAGRVGIPAKNYLPAVIVQEVATSIERQSTACDMYRHSINILVVLDMVKDFDITGIDDNIVDTHQSLRKIMEEADTDGAPKTDTVLGALMKQSNIRGTNYVYNINGAINYLPAFPGQDRFFYIAAELSLDLISQMVVRKQ